MYRWKRTIGKVEERPTWRSNWGYNQSLGLGYYEYFCFCEEIGAEPVPVLPGGFNPHKGVGVPLEEIGEWVNAFETRNLDEVIPLTDEKGITGRFAVAGNDIEGRIWEVRAADLDTRENWELHDVRIDEDNLEHLFMDIRSSHYKVFFRFQRTSGRKGLKIYFGEKDEKNRLVWEFGGWDNWDCNLTSCYAGRNSTISQRLFHVEDTEYFLELEVEDHRIRTWVNGILYNDAVDRLPELEELYVTASVDRNSDRTILKAVNLTGEAKEVQLILDGAVKNAVTVTCLKGCGLDETNSFENPDNIAPQTEHISVDKNEMSYIFVPHSVTILSFGNVG